MTDGSPKGRVACFVDGFNLYHAIDELRDENNKATFNHLKWVNLWTLAEAFIKPESQAITAVYYCSAYATYRPGPYARHRRYTAALRSVGVTLVMGAFKEKWTECKECGHKWSGHTEKETDVNLALMVIREASRNSFDHAIIVTADSDQCPTLRHLKDGFPDVTVQVVTPPNGFDKANELRSLAPAMKIKRKHLHNNLFPQIIDLPGVGQIVRPTEYDPPDG